MVHLELRQIDKKISLKAILCYVCLLVIGKIDFAAIAVVEVQEVHAAHVCKHSNFEPRRNIDLVSIKAAIGPLGDDDILISPFSEKPYHTFDDSVEGTLTYDGNDYTSVPTLFDDIIAETDAAVRAKQFMHMYEYTIITSQTKIEGFGGMGMLQYIGRTVAFKGIRVGTFELTSKGTINNQTSFQFKGYSDYRGLAMEGLQRSNTNTSGDGAMSEEVDFTIQGSSDTWTGSVNYDAIVLDGTLPKGGYYLIKFDVLDETGTQVNPLLTTNPGQFDYTDIIPNS